MDWLEMWLEKAKDRIKNYSLRKSMALYLAVAVAITSCAVGFTVQFCANWERIIEMENGITRAYRYVNYGVFLIYHTDESDDSISARRIILPDKERELYEALETAKTACIPVYALGAILLISFLYYKNKLEEPIALIRGEMAAIRRDDLSISCRYESRDEMGELCRVMDQMRLFMLENRQNMWALMEEQRKINAAFAHDLRTPLTVINGYVEMLSDHYAKGMPQEELAEILDAIRRTTGRLQDFSETMRDIHKFEMLEVKKVRHTKEELCREIRDMAEGLTTESGLEIAVAERLPAAELYYDDNVLMEVLGNLLSNAVRYADREIRILLEREGDTLFIYVKDDGRGMTPEELYKADSPYYSDKTKAAGGDGRQEHFGIGLTICKLLCRKHGGLLTLSNSVERGAIVCAQFFVE